MTPSQLRLAVAGAALVILIAVAGTRGVVVQRLDQAAAAAGEEQVERAASVAAGAVNRLLLQVDGTLASLPELLRQAGGGTAAEAGRALQTLAFQNLNFRDLLLVGPDGTVWASARPREPGRSPPVWPPESFPGHADSALSVLGPARNPATGEWAIFLARPVRLAGLGRVTVLAEVPLSLLAPVLAPAAGTTPGFRLSVEREDGTLLVSLPHNESRIGWLLDPPAGALPSDRPRPVLGNRFEGAAAVMLARPTLYRGIQVVAALDAATIAAMVERDRRQVAAAATAAAVLVVILALALVLVLEQRLRAAEERRRAREMLENAIQAMSDGFVIFDRDDRLVACNSRYRDIYALSAPFIVPGASFEHILREGARHGQYPEVAADIEGFVRATVAWHLGDQPPRERRLPDGRWILLTERRTRDGGTVGIRTDITNLKQAVEERAAGERRYAALARAGAAVTWRAAPDGVLLEASGWEALTGRPERALVADGWAGAVHPDDHAALAGWTRCPATPVALDAELRLLCASGWRWARVRGVPVLDPATGQPAEWIGTVHDVHERHLACAALVDSEARFARAVAAVGMGTWDWDPLTDALQHSAGFETLHGAPEGALRTAAALLNAVDRPDRDALASALAEACGTAGGLDAEFRITTGGTVRWLRMQGRAVDRRDGRAARVSGVTQDVTEKRLAEDRLAHMARHDALTGLPNRVELHARLGDMLAAAGRDGAQAAILYVDLDRFKWVNDTLGHPVGDALLRAVTERILLHLRTTWGNAGGLLARPGGDEFVVAIGPRADVVSDVVAQAIAVGRSLIEALSQLFEVEGHQMVIGASVGVAVYPHDGMTPDALLKNADLALHRAKAEGRGLVRCFEPDMDERAQARRLLELDLRRAVGSAPEEFELHYQPVIDVRTHAPVGFEALLRWRHPQRGMVSPADFIPLAEDIGLIGELGDLALRRACAEAARWPGELRVAVNLSPAQFRNPGLVDSISDALRAGGLPGRRLELEITEGVLLEGTEATLATLHRLKALGIRIAMDDFGTGYSSLSYLRSFPFDKVKIDRAFVRDLGEGDDDVAIVQAIIDLCSRLGMSTTAEGVETAAQFRLLAAARCTEVQGYLFSRPVPPREVPALLDRLAATDRLEPQALIEVRRG